MTIRLQGPVCIFLLSLILLFIDKQLLVLILILFLLLLFLLLLDLLLIQWHIGEHDRAFRALANLHLLALRRHVVLAATCRGKISKLASATLLHRNRTILSLSERTVLIPGDHLFSGRAGT